MKLVAVLACRNQSSRLYAKPLQNLDVKRGITIVDYMIAQLKMHQEIKEIVLAISENAENLVYQRIAKKKNIPYVLGDDSDVLSRLIKGAELVKGEHIFRVTTESPYTYLDNLLDVYNYHCVNKMDYSSTEGLPDGACFEIISLEALKRSWLEGKQKHRSELCTLYISENKNKFKIIQHAVPQVLRRRDIRLTVDWPEDLIVMRKIYEDLNLSPQQPHSVEAIISYLDKNPKINTINNWIDSGLGRVWR